MDSPDFEPNLTQSIILPLFDPHNEMVKTIKGLESTSIHPEQIASEIIAQLPGFITELRAHPQIPIKSTTNIGGDTPLELDLLAIMRMHAVKVAEACRLEPEQFQEASGHARALFLEIANQQPENFHTLLGLNDQISAAITQEQYISDGSIVTVLTNNAFAERLAAIAKDIGITVPDYDTSVQIGDSLYCRT